MTAVSAFSLAARLQERGKIAALPELGDPQRHRADARLPDPLPIAVALIDAAGRALAVAGASELFHLQLHHAAGDEGDHLSEEIGVGALLNELLEGDPVDGHGIRLSVGSCWQTEPTLSRTMTAPTWGPGLWTARAIGGSIRPHYRRPTPPPGTPICPMAI